MNERLCIGISVGDRFVHVHTKSVAEITGYTTSPDPLEVDFTLIYKIEDKNLCMRASQFMDGRFTRINKKD